MNPLLTKATGSVDEMTESYSEGLISSLDIHAPTIRNNVTRDRLDYDIQILYVLQDVNDGPLNVNCVIAI